MIAKSNTYGKVLDDAAKQTNFSKSTYNNSSITC